MDGSSLLIISPSEKKQIQKIKIQRSDTERCIYLLVY